jgi:hypothetical protein
MIEIDPKWEKAVDRLRAGVENERVPSKLQELLDYELTPDEIQAVADEIRSPADELREQATELEAKADEIDAAAQLFETFGEKVIEATEKIGEWQEAEGRDDKAEAREALFGALQEVADAYDEVTGVDLDEIVVEGDEEGGRKVWGVEWDDGVARVFDQDGVEILPPDAEQVSGALPPDEVERVLADRGPAGSA